MLRALGYEVSTTAFQNLLNFKTKMIEKPVLEPVPRSAVMQTLVDAMSANSPEEALQRVKPTLDDLFPLDYPWTIKEVGERLIDMYRELGIEVENLSPNLAKQLGYQKGEEGVVVTKVKPNSPASMVGIRPGTLILAINHKKISNIEEFNAALKDLENKNKVLILTKQGNVTRFYSLQIN